MSDGRENGLWELLAALAGFASALSDVWVMYLFLAAVEGWWPWT